MHSDYFGDSFDLVKRFFCQELRALGYRVYADPMFSQRSESISDKAYCRLIGVRLEPKREPSSARRALFMDPDTGVQGERRGRKYVTFSELAERAARYQLVFAYDQSFAYGANLDIEMARKRDALAALGCSSMYYSSHAHFVFLSKASERLFELRARLLQTGVPPNRLITAARTTSGYTDG